MNCSGNCCITVPSHLWNKSPAKITSSLSPIQNNFWSNPPHTCSIYLYWGFTFGFCRAFVLIVCSQTLCAVLSHCFTDCTCAREVRPLFFVYKLLARATNYKTIALIMNSIKGLIIINTQDRGGSKYNFSSKKLIAHPNFVSNFHTPYKNLPKNFIIQHLQTFYVLIVFVIFKNPI